MRVEPTEEPGLNWRAAWPRGRCPSSIYSLSRCGISAWSAAFALAEQEKQCFPSLETLSAETAHPERATIAGARFATGGCTRANRDSTERNLAFLSYAKATLLRPPRDPTRRCRVSAGAAIANQSSPSKPPALARHLRGRFEVIMPTRVPDRLDSGPPVAISGEARHARGVTL
jgi:hypothetical protein